MTDLMLSPRSKLRWAEKHLADLEREIADFSSAHPPAITPTWDKDLSCV